ncbi:CG3841 [Drosophila busckii]|uniref:Carboxylic ester hydrolase n=1 Tax=Drosophila busckii TaxID=30019 RepID=A0A0M3QTK6_DROBS|nr:CG3841 [Drosophila busckii]
MERALKKYLLLLLPLLLLPCGCLSDKDIVVNTTLGLIEGTSMKSFSGKQIFAFRGVPYADPPLGELRFAEPRPVQAWNDRVLKATTDSLVCPQKGMTVFMSEDCLKLNVFTKNLNGSLPVIVYIHGGANVLGSGHSRYEAGPEYLLEHELLLVAFNYRLGALGFLNGGNYGYLDQVLALKWVQRHIAKFGGDPRNVTIMGMSAGSMAVSLHLVSPLSQGLFQRAILMSGSATNHYSIQNGYWTSLLARQFACPMYAPYLVAACLRNVTWQRIMEVCADWEPYKFVNMKWNYEVDYSFLPAHPSELLAQGQFERVPLLVSFAANELDYSTYELFLFDYNETKSRRLRDFYLGEELSELNETNVEQFGQIFSDAILGHGVHRLVQLAKQHTSVYYTRMDYVGQRSLSAPQIGPEKKLKGVGHADDLQYVMPGLWYGSLMDKDHPDVFMMQRLTQWFAHFAATGQPLSDLASWPPVNATHTNLLYNNVTTSLGSAAYAERYALWDELFPMVTRSAASRQIFLNAASLFVALTALGCKLM